ncbi:T9SS type A sorting domain-containing protein [Nostoc sp. NIES-2111]
MNLTTVWATAFDGSGNGADYTNVSITTNGGTTWTPRTVPASSGMSFADFHAVSSTTAWAAMVNTASGGGEVYKTTNGGVSWSRQNSAGFSGAGAFLDALHMFSSTSGFMVGDPVNGEFEIYRTTNGGTSWTAVSGANIPDPLTGEFGLLRVVDGTIGSTGWFGTNLGRVFRTTDGGVSWSAVSTGLGAVNHLAFSTSTRGIALEYDANGNLVAMAQTTDGGLNWSTLSASGTVYTGDLKAVSNNPGYYVSSSAFQNAAQGSSYSSDYGLTWTTLESGVQRTAIGGADASAVWAGSYTSSTNTGGIFKGSLPTSTPLDPPPAWTLAAKAGSDINDDFGFATATDASGNVYVAGSFTGSATFGSITLTGDASFSEGYLVKYAPSGVALWAVSMGGSSTDQLRAVTVSPNGNVYASGFVIGAGTAGSLSIGTAGNGAQAIILRYDPNTGDALWAQTGGSTLATALSYNIAADGSGNVYATGSYDSTNVAFGSISLPYGGLGDAFIVSYGSTGTLRWIKNFSTANEDIISAVTSTSAGDVTIGGTFTGNITIGGVPLTNNGGTDGFLAGYTSAGTFRWADSFGSSADDGVNDLTVDPSGNVTAVGYLSGGFTFGSNILTVNGPFNILTVSYSSTGTKRWGAVTGGATGDSGYNIASDATGNVYITGFFQGTASFGSGSVTSVGGSDVLVGKYTSAGVPVWVTRAGGAANDFGRGIAIGASNAVYVTGNYNTSTIGFGTLSLTNAGSSDGFIARLGSACAVSTPTLSSNGPICSGQQLTLTGSNVDAGTTSVITGPNSYSVASSSGTISNASTAASGTYTLTVTLAPGCSATATTSVVVNALPSAPTVSPVTLCGPGSATLIAGNVPVGGSIGWYTSSTGTVPFFTGSSYTTPTLSANTTYWVRAISASSCRSNAVSVTVTVNGSGVPPTISFTGATEFCQGGSLVLTGSGGGPYLWSNGSTGNSITVSASGTYTVSTALSSCTLTSAPVVVTVRPLPSTPATTDASNCGPGSVTLTASGGAPNDVYNWYTSATGGSPIASGSSYTTPVLNATRVYYAELVRTGCASATRSSATANILPAATATLAAQGSTTLCPGDSVRLNATGSAGSWQYYRSGALVPSGTNQSLVVRDSGTYFVVATQGTCTAISNSIRVNLNAAPAAAQVVPAERCGPGSVALTASGAPANGSYAWYTAPTGGSPIVGANGATYNTPVLAANTTYYVAIVDPSLTCLAPRVPVLAGINSVPTVSLAATGPTTFCRGDSVKLLANSNASVTYQFNRSGFPIQGANATSLVVRDSGTYSITVTTAQNCSATSSTIRVNVNPAGDATFAYATSTLCLGGTGSVLPTISGTPGGTFSASPSGLVIDASTGAIALSGSQPNTYVVSYQVSGICPAIRSQVITVTAAPSATFSYAQSSGCAGSTGTIVPSFASGSSAGVFSSTTGLVIDPVSGAILLANSQPGTYTVLNTIAASGTCPGTVATASFTVNPAPATPTINSQTQGNGILLTSSAAAGNQWFLNGNPVPGGTGQTLLINDPANNGTYTLQVTANGCTSAFSAGSVVTITGIADGLGSLKLTLAPNPTTDGRTQLKLTGARTGETVQIRVLDALGRVVYTATPVAEATEMSHELNLSVLPKGMYTVRVSTTSRVLTQALIQE